MNFGIMGVKIGAEVCFIKLLSFVCEVLRLMLCFFYFVVCLCSPEVPLQTVATQPQHQKKRTSLAAKKNGSKVAVRPGGETALKPDRKPVRNCCN
jgi:hypothetical protein